MSYAAPVKDMLFVMKEIAGIDKIAMIPGFEDFGYDTAAAVLEESAKFCNEVIAPLNRDADINPSTWRDGKVTVTSSFKKAFHQFSEGGWQGHSLPLDNFTS